jgi:hypothetical protein
MSESIVPNYVQPYQDGTEFVVETTQGLAYASKRATARMLGVDEKTVRKEIEGADYCVLKNAQVQTSGGIQGADLISATVVYKLAFKFNPDLAFKMGEAGANLYMLNAAGYKVEVKESDLTPPGTAQDNFYPWEDRKTFKAKWNIDKIIKRNKSGMYMMFSCDSGWWQLAFFNDVTTDRMWTWFTHERNIEAVAQMYQLVDSKHKNGGTQMSLDF